VKGEREREIESGRDISCEDTAIEFDGWSQKGDDASPPRVFSPSHLMRYLLLSVDRAYLIDCEDVGGQPAVYVQHAAINYCTDREGVKALDAMSPGRRIAVLSVALVVEAVNLRDLLALFSGCVRREGGREERKRKGPGRKRGWDDGNGRRMAFVGVVSSSFAHLVIPPEKRDVTGRFQLQAKEEAQRLD
jgi:hypothetical protein